MENRIEDEVVVRGKKNVAFGPHFFIFFFHFQIALSIAKPLVISFRPKTQKPLSGKTFSRTTWKSLEDRRFKFVGFGSK